MAEKNEHCGWIQAPVIFQVTWTDEMRQQFVEENIDLYYGDEPGPELDRRIISDMIKNGAYNLISAANELIVPMTNDMNAKVVISDFDFEQDIVIDY